MAGRKSHYAILRGVGAPCIVTDWIDCRDRVYGFSGCRFKGFHSRADAYQWLKAQGAYTTEESGPMPDLVRADWKQQRIEVVMQLQQEAGFI